MNEVELPTVPTIDTYDLPFFNSSAKRFEITVRVKPDDEEEKEDEKNDGDGVDEPSKWIMYQLVVNCDVNKQSNYKLIMYCERLKMSAQLATLKLAGAIVDEITPNLLEFRAYNTPPLVVFAETPDKLQDVMEVLESAIAVANDRDDIQREFLERVVFPQLLEGTGLKVSVMQSTEPELLKHVDKLVKTK